MPTMNYPRVTALKCRENGEDRRPCRHVARITDTESRTDLMLKMERHVRREHRYPSEDAGSFTCSMLETAEARVHARETLTAQLAAVGVELSGEQARAVIAGMRRAGVDLHVSPGRAYLRP